MAKQKTLHDLFHDTLKDIYFAEKKILTALPKMAKAANSDELRAAFEKHEAETEKQVERLEQVFAELGETPRGKTCPAINGIVEEGQEISKEFKGTPALDAGLLSAAQAVEHYEISRYGTLKTWAAELAPAQVRQAARRDLEGREGDRRLADQARRNRGQSAGRGRLIGAARHRAPMPRTAPVRSRDMSMNVGDERSRSLWMDVEVAPTRSRCRATRRPIRSSSAAASRAFRPPMSCPAQGQQVIVVDRGRIGSGMTARTTAHLDGEQRRRLQGDDRPPRREAREGLLCEPGRGHFPDRDDPGGRKHRLRFPPRRRFPVSRAADNPVGDRRGARGLRAGRDAGRDRGRNAVARP